MPRIPASCQSPPLTQGKCIFCSILRAIFSTALPLRPRCLFSKKERVYENPRESCCHIDTGLTALPTPQRFSEPAEYRATHRRALGSPRKSTWRASRSARRRSDPVNPLSSQDPKWRKKCRRAFRIPDDGIPQCMMAVHQHASMLASPARVHYRANVAVAQMTSRSPPGARGRKRPRRRRLAAPCRACGGPIALSEIMELVIGISVMITDRGGSAHCPMPPRFRIEDGQPASREVDPGALGASPRRSLIHTSS